MSDTKQTVEHTPGPWEVVNQSPLHMWILGPEQGDGLRILVGDIAEDHDAGEANARLIAAAPELLEALKNTLAYAEAYYRTLPDDGAEQDAMMTGIIEPARAAIAKAEPPTD